MSDKLVVSVSLLTGRFHGKGQGNAAEWPPAPFRLFQALVAGAAQTISVDAARSALLWLEIQATSSIRTPSAYKGNKINLYVLTNQRDKAIGTKKSEAELKTKKVIEPIILASDQDTEFKMQRRHNIWKRFKRLRWVFRILGMESLPPTLLWQMFRPKKFRS